MNRQVVRLCGVGLTIGLSTACLKSTNALVLEGDGSGTYSSEMAFTPATAKAMHDLAALAPDTFDLSEVTAALPSVPDKAQKKAMKALGLTKVKVASDAELLSVSISCSFDHPSSLQALEQISPDAPSVDIVAKDPAHVTLTMHPNSGMASSTEDMSKPQPEMPPEAAAQMMGIMGTLMSEMNSFSVVNSITVPGEITAVSPPLGAAYVGDTATWTIDMAAISTLMGAGQDADALKSQFSGGFQVEFRPKAPLPTTVLTK